MHRGFFFSQNKKSRDRWLAGIVSAPKRCQGQCLCDFSWPFPHVTKRLPRVIHCAYNQSQKKDRLGWLINFSYLESKTSSESLPFILKTCPYVTEATCGSYTSHFPATREAGKVRLRYCDWLPCTTSWAEGLVGMADGSNGSWVDSHTCYAVFWFTRLHLSLSFISLSTICCRTHTVLFIASLPVPHTTVKLKHE